MAILNRSGFEALAEYSGEQAIELASRFLPDTLVCDLFLPGMNGIDTLIRMRKLLPSISLLLLSGQAVADDLLEAAREQGLEFDVLAKPVHPSELLAKLSGIRNGVESN